MRSRWLDAEAKAAVARWGAAFGEDLALRAYTSRLLEVIVGCFTNAQDLYKQQVYASWKEGA